MSLWNEIKLITVCMLFWLSLVPLTLTIVSVPLFAFFCYRIIITQILRRLLRRDLGSALTSLDFGFSYDDFHGKPRGALAVVLTIDGKLKPNLIEKKLSAAFEGYPEGYRRMTTIYPTFWLGYPFWTALDRQFDVSHHMKIVRGENTKEIIKNWFDSAFAPGQPLWDCLLIPEYEDSDGTMKSIFAVRIHHVIGDGLSLLNFMQNKVGDHNQTPVGCLHKNNFKLSFFHLICMRATHLFWTPLVMCQEIYATALSLDILSSRLRSPEFFTVDFYIPLKDIKALRQRLSQELNNSRVSFMNTTLLCVTGALRRICFQDVEITPGSPNHINVSAPTPTLKTHPSIQQQYIGNQWGLWLVKLPIAETNPLKRLECLITQEKWLKRSGAFETNLQLLNLNVIFPRTIYARLIQSLRGTTCGFSLMPPVSEITVCGYSISKSIGIAGLQGKQTSMVLTAGSHNNAVKFCATVDSRVFPENVTEHKIQEYFSLEVKQLLESKWR